MKTLGLSMLIALVVTCGGCVIGPRGDRHPAITSPGGVTLTLRIETVGESDFELLSVEDDAFTLRRHQDDEILIVPLHRVETMSVEGNRQRLRGRSSWDRLLESLRLQSRYPQGISDDLMRDLLEAYDLTEVTDLRSRDEQ